MEEVPETGAVFTFGKSRFGDDNANKFWVKNDPVVAVACGDEHTAVVTTTGRLTYVQLCLHKLATVMGYLPNCVLFVICSRSRDKDLGMASKCHGTMEWSTGAHPPPRGLVVPTM